MKWHEKLKMINDLNFNANLRFKQVFVLPLIVLNFKHLNIVYNNLKYLHLRIAGMIRAKVYGCINKTFQKKNKKLTQNCLFIVTV